MSICSIMKGKYKLRLNKLFLLTKCYEYRYVFSVDYKVVKEVPVDGEEDIIIKGMGDQLLRMILEYNEFMKEVSKKGDKS